MDRWIAPPTRNLFFSPTLNVHFTTTLQSKLKSVLNTEVFHTNDINPHRLLLRTVRTTLPSNDNVPRLPRSR